MTVVCYPIHVKLHIDRCVLVGENLSIWASFELLWAPLSTLLPCGMLFCTRLVDALPWATKDPKFGWILNFGLFTNQGEIWHERQNLWYALPYQFWPKFIWSTGYTLSTNLPLSASASYHQKSTFNCRTLLKRHQSLVHFSGITGSTYSGYFTTPMYCLLYDLCLALLRINVFWVFSLYKKQFQCVCVCMRSGL